jgi:hypothetical protein
MFFSCFLCVFLDVFGHMQQLQPLSSTLQDAMLPISSIYFTTCQRWPVPIISSTLVVVVFDGCVSYFVCFE